MSIKTSITAAGAIALMFALTACTGGTDEVPSETKAPAAVETTAPEQEPTTVETPVAGSSTDNEFALDLSQVTYSDEVVAAYGQDALNKVTPLALTITSLGFNELTQLHEQRDGSQDAAILTGAFQDYLTPEALAVLVSTPGEGDSQGLVPTVNPDGTILEGVAAQPGIQAAIRTYPSVSLFTGETADAQKVQVDVPLEVTIYRESGNAVVNRDLRLYFIPSADGSWDLASWGWADTPVEGA